MDFNASITLALGSFVGPLGSIVRPRRSPEILPNINAVIAANYSEQVLSNANAHLHKYRILINCPSRKSQIEIVREIKREREREREGESAPRKKQQQK